MTIIRYLIGSFLLAIYCIVYLTEQTLYYSIFETYQLPTYFSPKAIMLDYYVGFT